MHIMSSRSMSVTRILTCDFHITWKGIQKKKENGSTVKLHEAYTKIVIRIKIK